MELTRVLQSIDLFEGLNSVELEQIAAICTERQYEKNEIIVNQGESGNELYVITAGFAEVELGDKPKGSARVVVSLGSGQVIGEMALLDQGPRSASIRATGDPTRVQVIEREAFENLCNNNNHIGYIVMRNLAVDLSFKLRHRNLSER